MLLQATLTRRITFNALIDDAVAVMQKTLLIIAIDYVISVHQPFLLESSATQ